MSTGYNYTFLSITVILSFFFNVNSFAIKKYVKLNQQINASKNLDLGLSYYKKSELDKALNYLTLAKQESIKQKDTSTIIKALTGIGKVHADRGENPIALSFYQSALTLAEKTDNQLNIAHIEKNIGVLYISWKNFDKALHHYSIAQQIAIKIGDDKLLADCYNNKGTVYEQLEQHHKALEAYGKALSFYQKNKSLPGIAMSYSNIAIVRKQQKQYQKSIHYNLKALEIMEKMGEKWMQAATLNNIGSVYYSMSNYQNTLIYCEKSLRVAQNINAKEIEVAAYETLADAAAALKNYSLAYQYMAKFHKVNQDFINTEKTHQFSELEIKYKTEKKEQQITLLNKQAKIRELELDKRKQTIFIILVLFVFSFLIAYQFYNRYKLKKKAELHSLLSSQQESATKAIIEAEENERKRIAGDLHDGVGQLLSAASMNLSMLGKKLKFEDVEGDKIYHQTVKLLKDSYKEMRSISHQMMPDALLNLGLPDATQIFLLEINSTFLQTSFHAEGFEKRLDSTVEIMIYRVIQECVNNIIKHANASHFHVQLEVIKNYLTCTIEDNGKGFDTLSVSNGIGMNNIKSRINFIKGTIKTTSTLNRGTLISINVPI